MKRTTRWVSLLAVFAILITPLLAAAGQAAPAEDKSPFAKIAGTVSAITGIAISPMLGTGGYGVYQYVSAKTAEQKAALPWYAKPTFFLPALLLVGICACKDSLGAVVPPGLKKPLDIIETIENKASGLVAAGAVVPLTVSSVSDWIFHSGSAAAGSDHVSSAGFAMMHFGAMDFSWLLNILTVPLSVTVFVFVWMASHAINVLILLSPWGAVDAVLKVARTSVLGLITLTAHLDPRISAVLSLIIIVIAYFVAGWSFRLTVFGSIFCWDFFTGRKKRFQPAPNENWVFSGGKITGVPIRTYGRMITDAQGGRTVFAYKPWLVMPERRADVLMTAPFVGKGMFFSTVRDGDYTFFLLPPRYRTHEEQFAASHKLPGGVKDAGLLKAWGAIRELFSGSATKAQVV